MAETPKGTLLAMPGISRPDQPIGLQPSPEVVSFIERLLAEAKRGEIRSIGVAYVRPGNVCADGFASDGTDSHSLFAAIADLFHTCAARRSERSTYVHDETLPPKADT